MGRWIFPGLALVALFVAICPPYGSATERYTVKPGDSLYTISRAYGVSVDALKEANGLKDGRIQPKQVLLVPDHKKGPAGRAIRQLSSATEPYIVKQGDHLYALSKRTGLSVEAIKKMNQLHSDTLKTGQRLLLPRQMEPRGEETEEIGDPEDAGEARQIQLESRAVSEPLGKWKDPEERGLFVRVVKTFLGVPYRLGGYTLKGLDCSAFVKKIFDIFNVQLPRTAREQLRIGKKIAREELEEGDLIFFKTRQANNVHVGIYIGNNEFVHASYRGKEVRVDNLETHYFNQRFINGVRVIELERES